ncbi:hypothetical protein [Azospira restricta]|uniref:Uncharacterized protein n=1 Tax=Azospira restricta TaxID=404405 RepID=A0A974PVJ1_9RHOO|nr:hypothetical protein [Azospira restricta]QRJ62307.1 hypothetical protein IWH25_10925 [Azospira restricta]
MATPKTSFSEARDAFVKALTDYQTATRDMSLALQRISERSTSFYQSLQTVVNTSGSLIAPRR